MDNNSTKRFSNRVEDYVKYRPRYPGDILNYLQDHFGLETHIKIADIGAGTGISAALFLDAGYAVWAVEPNPEMRQKSIELLKHYPLFMAIDGKAEHTGLPDHSVDVIVSAQAFHWFDTEKSKTEFRRILKDYGLVVLIWNERKTSSPFEAEYESLIIKHSRDYLKIDHRNISDQDVEVFFSPQTCSIKIFDNYQAFDFNGLKGRLLSSSYMPAENENGYIDMIRDLDFLYKKYNKDDLVRINYDTKLYAGFLK